LELALAVAHFWLDTVPERPGGLDGSRWILEGVRTDRHVLADHWSPQEVGPDAAFRRAGNYILDLAHIPPGRARLRAPSNNRLEPTVRGHRFVEGLAPSRVYEDHWLVVRAEVVAIWKESLADTVEVWTPRSCGTRFETGGDYLVYAH